MMVLNGQRANGILLDRLGSRRGGIARRSGGERRGRWRGRAWRRTATSLSSGRIAESLPEALAAQGAWFRGIGGFASLNGNARTPGFNDTQGGRSCRWGVTHQRCRRRGGQLQLHIGWAIGDRMRQACRRYLPSDGRERARHVVCAEERTSARGVDPRSVEQRQHTEREEPDDTSDVVTAASGTGVSA